MNTELRADKDLLTEIQEADKVSRKAEEAVTYTVTYDYGGFLSIICC